MHACTSRNGWLTCVGCRYNSLAHLEAWHSSDVRATHLKQLDSLNIVETAAEYETQSGYGSIINKLTYLNACMYAYTPGSAFCSQ